MVKSENKPHNQMVGKWGEDLAASFLKEKGFSVVAQNHHTSEGEIDLIIQNSGLVVFVEVKTREHNANGYPEEAITEEKLEHMHNSAEVYLQQHPEIGDNWRLDVISITGMMNQGSPEIEWFEDVD